MSKSKPGSWFGGSGKPGPLTSTPPAPGKGGAPDAGVIQPGKPGDGSISLPPPGPGKDKGGADAPTAAPPIKDKPDAPGGAGKVGGAAAAGAGVLGLGAGIGGASIAGAVQAAGNAATAAAAGDAAKKVAEETAKIIKNLTEFLSDPTVLSVAVGLTALVILGPTVASSMRR